MNIPAPSSGSSTPPKIEDGLAVARFNDIYFKDHPDWAVDKDKFGHKDDGGRFHFNATVLDDQRQPILLSEVLPPEANIEDPTLEFDLEAMTRNMSSHEKSSAYAHLKGILTPQEFQQWQQSTAENPADLSAVANREVNIKVSHNTKGWPQIEAFLGPAKPLKGR
jgi:hypothetical protein